MVIKITHTHTHICAHIHTFNLKDMVGLKRREIKRKITEFIVRIWSRCKTVVKSIPKSMKIDKNMRKYMNINEDLKSSFLFDDSIDNMQTYFQYEPLQNVDAVSVRECDLALIFDDNNENDIMVGEEVRWRKQRRHALPGTGEEIFVYDLRARVIHETLKLCGLI